MPGIMQTLVDLQKWIYGSLTEYLDAFSATGDWISLATVLPLGIVFGAIHALTPGHGKMVLASYLVGSRLAGGLDGLMRNIHCPVDVREAACFLAPDRCRQHDIGQVGQAILV